MTGVYPPGVDTPMLAAEQPLQPPELLALSDGKNPLTPTEVAEAMLDATATGKARVVLGTDVRAAALIAAVSPGLLARYGDRRIAAARPNRRAGEAR